MNSGVSLAMRIFFFCTNLARFFFTAFSARTGTYLLRPSRTSWSPRDSSTRPSSAGSQDVFISVYARTHSLFTSRKLARAPTSAS